MSSDPSLTLEVYRRTVVTSLGTVSYLDIGSGPTTVFVHGVVSHAYLWRHVIVALAGERRCIAFDLPLHGQSPLQPKQETGFTAFAALLNAALDTLGLTGVDLVANDTGGGVAQVMAATRPERFASLALTNCETQDNTPPRALRPTVLLARVGLLAILAPRSMHDLARARRAVYRDAYQNLETLPLQLVESFLRPLVGDRHVARQFQRLFLSLRASELVAVESRLRTLPVPTLIVWGDDDRFFDLRWAHWLCTTIPNTSGPHIVPGGRLFFPDERSSELTNHLRRFWHRADARS